MAPNDSATLPRVRHPLTLFFGLAYFISWITWAPLWLAALGLTHLTVWPYQHALGAFGPLAAALIVASMEKGTVGAKQLLRGMLPSRPSLKWMIVAVLGPFALLLFAILLTALLGERVTPLAQLGRSPEFPQLTAGTFFIYNLLTFGFGEETGWRGFALPRLQQGRSPMVATLLLTAGWAIWHWPLFLYRPSYMSMGVFGVLGWLASLFTGAILLTWLYNSSGGSILVVALFHASVDIIFTTGPMNPLTSILTGAQITFWGVVVLIGMSRMRSPSNKTPNEVRSLATSAHADDEASAWLRSG